MEVRGTFSFTVTTETKEEANFAVREAIKALNADLPSSMRIEYDRKPTFIKKKGKWEGDVAFSYQGNTDS